MWSDFNAANKEAMLKSELLSWPVTLGILVLAFGSLVAAGLPLMLTIAGLVSAAGTLFLGAQLFDISIWAMNFALMFALALGIDYALFIVVRYRAALFGSGLRPAEAVAVAMDTAGKAVLFSGATVLISLSAVMLVPSPAFRSMALGIMLSVLFVLAASLTLLPAVLAKLGGRVNRVALPWVHGGEHRSPRFARWAELLWRRPWAFGAASVAVLVALAIPVLGLDTGMPSIAVVPREDSARQGYEAVQAAFGPGAPGALQLVAPAGEAAAAAAVAQADPGVALVTEPRPSADGRLALLQAVPVADPSDPAVGATIDRLRDSLPSAVLVGGAVGREPRPGGRARLADAARDRSRPRARLRAAARRAPGAGPGRAGRRHEPAGHGRRLRGREARLPGRTRRGAARVRVPGLRRRLGAGLLLRDDLRDLDGLHRVPAVVREGALGPLARSARGGGRGLAHSGRVIFAAAAVMVAVFFTFAISGPLPPKEMGIILGVAVLLDAALVRLVLVPVLLRLTGPWAWWLPRWVDRWLPDLRFGHS